MNDFTVKERLNLNGGDDSVPLRKLCGEAYEEIDRLEREVAELRAAGDAVVPFLVAEKPIDYVADGEAWNKRAAFLSLHQAAYHKFREEWVARKKMNQPHAQGGV